MIKVIIASSLSLMREGVKRILSPIGDMEVVGTCNCLAEVCARPRNAPKELLILVHPLADASEKLLDSLRETFPAIQTVVVASGNVERSIEHALKIGARGLVSYRSPVEVLPEAIRSVANGHIYTDRLILENLIDKMSFINANPGKAKLSCRELQVLRAITCGERVREIACNLGISSKTVSTHKARLMDKLRVGSTSELIQYTVETGIVDCRAENIKQEWTSRPVTSAPQARR